MASEVDLRIERDIREFLTTAAPDIGFLGEENGHKGNRDRYWALDPIDGTANYVRGLPLCAVSLALVDHDHPVVGVIRLPFLGQLYTAEHGRGAYEAGRRLQVSATAELRDAIVAIGDYAVGDGANGKNRARLTLTRYLAEKAQRVRMLGTAAIDLAWVASGQLDASLTLSNKPWDMAAGALLVQEAGGRVVDRDGTDLLRQLGRHHRHHAGPHRRAARAPGRRRGPPCAGAVAPRSVPVLRRHRPTTHTRPRPALVPLDDPRRLPHVRPPDRHVRLRHLPPLPVRADRPDPQPR